MNSKRYIYLRRIRHKFCCCCCCCWLAALLFPFKFFLGLNCRIPCHLFACHWIRIASIVLCFVLQRTPTNENNGGTEWQGIQQFFGSMRNIHRTTSSTSLPNWISQKHSHLGNMIRSTFAVLIFRVIVKVVGNDDRNWIYSSPTEKMSDAILLIYPFARRPRKKCVR